MSCYLQILVLLGLFFAAKNENEPDTITVSHNILRQESYYNTEDKIYGKFIDFTIFTMYTIDMEKIYHKKEQGDPLFELTWLKKKEDEYVISIRCVGKGNERIKCAKISLLDHDFTAFDFDRLIYKFGGCFAYLLILYGLFSLRMGYVYFNLSVIFYCSFGYLLLIREICQFLELIGHLNSEHSNSKVLFHLVFYFSLFTCMLYGAVCHYSKYLKYITFGFIDGLIFAKIISYFLIRFAFENDLVVKYLIIEIVICIVMIALFIIAQNKNDIVNILNISLISSFGLIYAINILFGGLPFIPYYILGKQAQNSQDDIMEKLTKGDSFLIYLIIFIVMITYGYYKNNINFKIAIHKKPKN
jgi:hypothetical protein